MNKVNVKFCVYFCRVWISQEVSKITNKTCNLKGMRKSMGGNEKMLHNKFEKLNSVEAVGKKNC